MNEENQVFAPSEEKTLSDYVDTARNFILPILLKINGKNSWGYLGLLLVGLLLLDVILEVGGIINSIPIYNNVSQVVFTTWLISKLITVKGRQSLKDQYEAAKKIVLGKVEAETGIDF